MNNIGMNNIGMNNLGMNNTGMNNIRSYTNNIICFYLFYGHSIKSNHNIYEFFLNTFGSR